MIFKKNILTGLILIFFVITGCSKAELDAPCSNYGKHCSQMPINF